MVEDLVRASDGDLRFCEEPITISVSITRRWHEIINFVDAYNTFNATATEVTKYDAHTQTAAPLLMTKHLDDQ